MRRTLYLLLIASLTNYVLSGCTVPVRLSVEELASRQQARAGDAHIAALIVPPDTVRFDSLGGLFDERTSTVAGLTEYGTPIRLDFSKIRKVLIHVPESPEDSLIEVGFPRIRKFFPNAYLERIRAVHLRAEDTGIAFPADGAWLHPAHQIVCGTAANGAAHILGFENIDYVTTTGIDSGKTTTLVMIGLGCLLAGAITLGLVLQASMQ
ncbi:MAG: hypothetical protein KKA42_11190 [candidate division Zixibacteria bacterium]|nr:hypothetical protein [candidate division Zixibacteria bacterium]